MDLNKYFESSKGVGFLTTTDEAERFETPVSARPIIIDSQTIAFIMRANQPYRNLSLNPKAVYIYLEESDEYEGKRLFITKTGEEKDSDKLLEIYKNANNGREPDKSTGPMFLVYFNIDEIHPLLV